METSEINEAKNTLQLTVLSEVQTVIENHLSQLHQFISNANLQQLTHRYAEFQEREIEIGLNVFQLVSDTYYKENFHSDILKAILDPEGLHKEGPKYLHSFISYLNQHSGKSWIKKEDYQNAVVEREAGRIDISIIDSKSKKAIIIENKMNNAGDMERQIPRYVAHLEKKGFEIDLVLYLVLNGHKEPTTHNWTQAEIAHILPKVIQVSAYNETPKDLYNGWLSKCEKQAQNIDTLFLIRQYNNLIAYLGGKNMNKPLMEEFLQSMLVNKNYSKAMSLNAMLQDLINYRRDKILDTFKFDKTPFTRVYDWKHYAVLDNCHFDGIRFAIDIIVEQDRYRFQFFVRSYDNKETPINPATTFLQANNLIDDFFPAEDRWEKQFMFPTQEEELYAYIKSFKAILKEYTATSAVEE
ncbi:PD-(D/E)XK nuclease family protein [uncultured Pontibacter sp.]|uniref:PD-(D/E)XK nuclease family protein n=1 Tax=uncultured Pontibacter sp. TaxID=453356 RepID=UPI00262CA129|nr:PD-(D/E)XK nuclease family protein [uncultured Pontibacter sp.]